MHDAGTQNKYYYSFGAKTVKKNYSTLNASSYTFLIRTTTNGS